MRCAVLVRGVPTPRLRALRSHRRMKTVKAVSSDIAATRPARPVVDSQWLKSKLKESTTKVLDASWYMPTVGRKPVEEYKQSHIPGAQFFDINSIADSSIDLPHMLPTEAGFAAAADAVEIHAEDHVIVYDGMGLYSAARAWWMFKVFGHQQVSVLNGGFPAWKAEGMELEDGSRLTDAEVLIATEACRSAVPGQTKYPAKLDAAQVRNFEAMMELLKSKKEQIVDARPAGRFNGTVPEPREGLRPGHIPGSLNVPFSAVLTPEGHLKSSEELTLIFQNAGVDMNKDVVCSCGSGVTASVLALALDHIGFDKHVAIYDGSWSEWGAQNDTPVET